MNVSSPKHPKTHPDYGMDCEIALDLPVQDLIDDAVQAGWNTRTVIVALQRAAWNRALAYKEAPVFEDRESIMDLRPRLDRGESERVVKN